MPVTASRLGNSPITIDWTQFYMRHHEPDPATLAEAWKSLKNQFTSQEVGFYETPVNDELSQMNASAQLALQLLEKTTFTDCLFLGIGGSALGPSSLLQSLQHRRKSGIKFHFMENPDPVDWDLTIGKLVPDSTLICAVTKSGTTFETLAQLMLALQWLGKTRWQDHLVIITDPQKGELRTFASTENLTTLPIAPSIGGRFSIFSPVGLFPAALAGLSIHDFLLGARQVRDYTEKTTPEKNPLFILASHFIQYFPKKSVHVCMPYSTRLKTVSQWWVQLWAESLGKNSKGFSPIAAVGATDQHSLLQLLRDGPDDKITTFIVVDQVENPVKIPNLSSQMKCRLSTFQLLQEHSLNELLQTEFRATAQVLTRQNRPNLTFTLDKLDERSLGALYFSLGILTAFTGTLWGINPFDQPGVEEGKIYIREALSAKY